MVLFVMPSKVLLTFESVDEALVYGHLKLSSAFMWCCLFPNIVENEIWDFFLEIVACVRNLFGLNRWPA